MDYYPFSELQKKTHVPPIGYLILQATNVQGDISVPTCSSALILSGHSEVVYVPPMIWFLLLRTVLLTLGGVKYQNG